jgi:hypothetical protein
MAMHPVLNVTVVKTCCRPDGLAAEVVVRERNNDPWYLSVLLRSTGELELGGISDELAYLHQRYQKHLPEAVRAALH